VIRTGLLLTLALALVMSLSLGCKGEKGDTGPQGPAGPGTRKVYEGAVSGISYQVEVPEVSLADMPNIGVYTRFGGMAAGKLGGEPRPLQGGWMELPYTWSDGVYIYFQYAYFTTGMVTLENCDGQEYRIVVVE